MSHHTWGLEARKGHSASCSDALQRALLTVAVVECGGEWQRVVNGLEVTWRIRQEGRKQQWELVVLWGTS